MNYLQKLEEEEAQNARQAWVDEKIEDVADAHASQLEALQLIAGYAQKIAFCAALSLASIIAATIALWIS